MAVEMDLTEIKDDVLLTQVKELNDYGEYDLDDSKLTLLIKAAKNYMRMAGVEEVVINSGSAVDVIAYYVEDISRRQGVSSYVEQRVGQLRMWHNV